MKILTKYVDMKKLIFYSSIFILLSACSLNAHVTPEEVSTETQTLRDKYQAYIPGNWYYAYADSTLKCYEYYGFKADGTVVSYQKAAVRKLVTVAGKQVYTDWSTDINDTLKASKWYLFYDEDSKKNFISIAYTLKKDKAIIASNIWYEFVDASRDALHMQSIFNIYRKNTGTLMHEFKSGNPGPNF